MQAVKGLSMEKWLCWGSMGVAGFLLLLFVLDFYRSRAGEDKDREQDDPSPEANAAAAE